MKSYRSPSNPKVAVIPAKSDAELKEQHDSPLQLGIEMMNLSSEIAQIDARMNELESVIGTLTDKLNSLREEKAKKEARKLEIEQMRRS